MFIESPPYEPWITSIAVDPPVRLVSAAGGLVVAAGASLYTLRPGSQRIRARPLPSETEVVAVAAEPWSPYRLAIATPTTVDIYTGHRPYVPVMSATVPSREHGGTHLSWRRDDGEIRLYIRRRTGEILVINIDAQTTGSIAAENIAGIGGDAKGVLGMVDHSPKEGEQGWAYLLPVGAETFESRWIDTGPDAGEMTWTTYVAVHGKAIAYSTIPDDYANYGGSAEVSWAGDEEDDDTFKRAPGVFQGALAFQNERVIFAAYSLEGRVHILRWAREGSFTRIARFGLEDDFVTGTPASVTALAWDDERRVLWAASPELGLIKLTEPAPTRVKAAVKAGAN